MAGVARNAGADVDHGAPLGELGAETAVFDEALAQTVEAFGDHLAGTERQRLGPLVDLDAGERAGLLDDLDERRAVLGLLADRLVVEDDAGDVFRHRLAGAEHHLAVVAAIVLGVLDADRVEALLDRARGLVGRQNAAPRRDHGFGDLVEFSEVHGSPPCPYCPALSALITKFESGSTAPHVPAKALIGAGRRFAGTCRKRTTHARSASTPGSLRPSSHSRNAPPAVDT